MFTRTCNVLFTVLMLAVTVPLIANGQTTPPKSAGIAVVELFTSQGDVNCVEADRLLSEISADAVKNGKPVYCISLHVDFWNRFGWKDPFSSFRYTNRLQNYSSVFKEKETYTPKFLVNGKPVTGEPDKKTLNDIISGELNQPAVFKPTFEYQVFDDTLDVTYDLNENVKVPRKGSENYMNIVILESGLSTKVTKGDNAGKILRNDNVSRLFYTTNLTTSKGLLRIPLRGLKQGDQKTVLLFVQDKKTRRITGAASLPFRK